MRPGILAKGLHEQSDLLCLCGVWGRGGGGGHNLDVDQEVGDEVRHVVAQVGEG